MYAACRRKAYISYVSFYANLAKQALLTHACNTAVAMRQKTACGGNFAHVRNVSVFFPARRQLTLAPTNYFNAQAFLAEYPTALTV